MKIAAFTPGHDSSFATFNEKNDNRVRFYSFERIKNYKHSFGNLKEIIKILAKKADWDLIVFPSDKQNFDELLDETSVFGEVPFKKFVFKRFLKNTTKLLMVDHHFAHMMSAWNETEKSGIAIDGAGCLNRTETVVLNIKEAIEKNTLDTSKCFTNNIGKYFSAFGSKFVGGRDAVGALMGLQCYGNIDKNILANLKKINSLNEFKDYLNTFNINVLDENENFDAIRTIHDYLTNKIVKLFDEYFEEGDDIAYAGGCALNTVTNSILDKKYNLSICPAANDGGLSIGCLKLGMYLNGISIKNIDIISASAEKNKSPSTEEIKKAAKLLANNEIVAVAVDKDEIGPRALGYRSILMNPSIINGKKYINDEVKHRQWWRPFGGTVIDSSILKDYKQTKLDYFMLKNSYFKQEWEDKFKTIIHKDGSSRLQILNKENNESEIIYKIVKEFYKLTGIPGLLNTSFNISGKPIPASELDCLITWASLPRIKNLLMDKLYSREDIPKLFDKIYKK